MARHPLIPVTAEENHQHKNEPQQRQRQRAQLLISHTSTTAVAAFLRIDAIPFNADRFSTYACDVTTIVLFAAFKWNRHLPGLS